MKPVISNALDMSEQNHTSPAFAVQWIEELCFSKLSLSFLPWLGWVFSIHCDFCTSGSGRNIFKM